MRSGLSEIQAGCSAGVLIGEPRQSIELRQYRMGVVFGCNAKQGGRA